MITFIIRRLITAVFLLLVVSVITFAIFFLIPRLAGQNAAELAAQYVGRNPTPAAILQMEDKARPEPAAAGAVLAFPVRASWRARTTAPARA